MTRISDPEAIVRAVFALPVELSHREAAKRIGVHHTTVASIRCGQKFHDVLPGIPRLDLDMARTCCKCIHFKHQRILPTETEPERSGICGLGLPEAVAIKFARGCGAFAKAP